MHRNHQCMPHFIWYTYPDAYARKYTYISKFYFIDFIHFLALPVHVRNIIHRINCIKGNRVNEKTETAVEFNRFLQSVFTRESSQQEAISFEDDVQNLTSEQGILSLLLKSPGKKSPGPEALPNAFLKGYAEWVPKYLTSSRSI